MKVCDLLEALNDLPISALDMDIYVDNDNAHFKHVSIEAVTESCDDPTIIGYVIIDADAHEEIDEKAYEPLNTSGQLSFDFTKDVNK